MWGNYYIYKKSEFSMPTPELVETMCGCGNPIYCFVHPPVMTTLKFVFCHNGAENEVTLHWRDIENRSLAQFMNEETERLSEEVWHG